MKTNDYTRRKFIKTGSLTGLGIGLTANLPHTLFAGSGRNINTPAITGGKKIRTKDWPEWPLWKPETDEKRLLEVMRSGIWSRRNTVLEFEKKWAEMLGAKRSLTTVNGTNALICAVHNLDIGAGDEVITTPFTFIATPLSILQNGAIPVFADIDPETLQIDPEKIEAKITPNTRAIMPVHIYGLPADMNKIMLLQKNIIYW